MSAPTTSNKYTAREAITWDIRVYLGNSDDDLKLKNIIQDRSINHVYFAITKSDALAHARDLDGQSIMIIEGRSIDFRDYDDAYEDNDQIYFTTNR
jgi:hypothetical protein